MDDNRDGGNPARHLPQSGIRSREVKGEADGERISNRLNYGFENKEGGQSLANREGPPPAVYLRNTLPNGKASTGSPVAYMGPTFLVKIDKIKEPQRCIDSHLLHHPPPGCLQRRLKAACSLTGP